MPLASVPLKMFNATTPEFNVRLLLTVSKSFVLAPALKSKLIVPPLMMRWPATVRVWVVPLVPGLSRVPVTQVTAPVIAPRPETNCETVPLSVRPEGDSAVKVVPRAMVMDAVLEMEALAPRTMPPALMRMPPEKVSFVLRVRMPEPCCVNKPRPEIGPLTATPSERKKVSEVLFTMFELLPSVPLVAPLPTCNVPALIVVVPL